MRIGWLVLALLLVSADFLAAQRLLVEGNSRHPAAMAIRDIVERQNYLLIDRDTTLAGDSYLPADLLVVDATVRLEGAIGGSVGVVGGTLFIRPGARIDGISVAAPGIIGTSRLAAMGDTLFLPPGHRTEIVQVGDEYRLRINRPPRPPLVRPLGLFGLVLPTYDRVNGASVRVGFGGTIGGGQTNSQFRAVGSYHSARGAVSGVGEVRLALDDDASIIVRGGREVRTHDRWIRDDLSNSFSALFVRSDVRDYYESDFGSVVLQQNPPLLTGAGQGYFALRSGLVVSRDRSLESRDPWSAFGDDPWRENPEVFEGTLTSAVAGFTAGWRGRRSDLIVDTDVEYAFPSPVRQDWGELTFVQAIADARWQMLALRNHTLEMRARAMQTFGPDPAPRQRWSLIGGPGTLPTLEQGELAGDNLAFLQTTYAIPLRVQVPLLGQPSLAARHAVGSAWVTDGETPRWKQNLGAGLRFGMLDLFLYADPAESDLSPHFSFTILLPF